MTRKDRIQLRNEKVGESVIVESISKDSEKELFIYQQLMVV
ncbi:hypothetical protein [Chryseobacterium taichungense]|nr:hypothetical protein [Chryseobacterium taichungense]